MHTWRHDLYRSHPTVPGPDTPPTGRPLGHERFRIGRVEIAGDDRVVPTAHQHPATGAPGGVGRELRRVPRPVHQPNGRRVTDDFPGARHAHTPGIRGGGGRHRAHPGRRRGGMTALTITAAVIIVAAGAITQFRTAAVTTESAGGGTDAAIPRPFSSPVDGDDPMSARSPSTAGPVTPFQIRPAAVQVDLPDHRAATSGQPAGVDPGTALSPPTSRTPAASAAPTNTSTETSTEPTERPVPSADQAARPTVDGATEAPSQEPAAPAPVTAAQTPPPQAHAPDPTPTPTPTTAPPPSPTTTPEAEPARGNSADHRPEHANGGAGNTDHPKPSKPGSGPKD